MVSVVMLVYNSEKYIEESINSVLNQTFYDFEFIIVNDGSTDNSVDIIKSYNNDRIKLINNDHNYIQSLNIGMKKSKGKYIARMDSDDIMMPERLRFQYEFMENHPEVDICGSWMQTFGDRNDTIQGTVNHEGIVTSLLLYNTLSHPTVMLRKSSVINFGANLYKENYECAEDYKLWTDLALKDFHFAVIPEFLLKYRCSNEQVTNKRKEEMFKSTIKIQMEFAEKVMENILVKFPEYESLFDNIVTLFNDGKINYDLLLNIVYNFYKNYFKHIL